MPSVFLDAPRLDHSGQPAWFIASQQQAWEQFTALPMPGRRDENWRFAGTARLQFDSFKRVAPAAVPDFAGLEKTAARVITVNDSVILTEGPSVPGLEVLSLQEALARHGDLLEAHLKIPDTGLGGAKFAALHHAWLKDAVVITVAPGTEIASPVEIVHWLSGDHTAGFPRTLILAGAHSRVTVVESHLTADGGAALSCGAAQIAAGKGANVRYIQLNRQHAAARSFHFTTLRAEREASVMAAAFQLGSGYVRAESLCQIAGEGSRSDMLSVSLASDGQEIDQRTLQDHLSPHGYSDLLYKNVLFTGSRTIFAGLIRVADGAHFTDAYQKCRNLLLSDDCEANSMPGLEINADQVKCSHGSTSGQISGEEVFYFQSRGINRQTAEHMISLGFTQEVISRIGDESVERLILRAVENRFEELEK